MVNTALDAAASGMNARQTEVAVISNNLANISTNGFKKEIAEFQDLIYISEVSPGSILNAQGI